MSKKYEKCENKAAYRLARRENSDNSITSNVNTIFDSIDKSRFEHVERKSDHRMMINNRRLVHDGNEILEK